MSNETKLRDIEKRTFDFAVRIIKLCQVLDEKSGVAKVLRKQLLRSGTSIGANIEEAQAGQSKADFIHKNSIALKEDRETYYWLKLLVASEILPPEKPGSIQNEAQELTRILGAILVQSKNLSLILFLFSFTFCLLPFSLLLC
jgi:four helix bundle protein